MYKLKLLLLALVFLSACQKEDCENCPCNIENPLEEVGWLKDMVATSAEGSTEPRQLQILQFTYEGECVFWIDNCYNCADKMVLVYNYEKEEICRFGGIIGFNTCPDFLDIATERKVLLEDF